MAGDADAAGGVPRVRRVDVVTRPQLQVLVLGALHHHEVEADRGDQDLARRRRRSGSGRAPATGPWCRLRCSNPGSKLVLRMLRREPRAPQEPRHVAAEPGRDHEADHAEPVQAQPPAAPAGVPPSGGCGGRGAGRTCVIRLPRYRRQRRWRIHRKARQRANGSGRRRRLHCGRERGLALARGAQRHPARGRPAHGGAGPDRGRGRQRQDPGPHPSDRLPDPRAKGSRRGRSWRSPSRTRPLARWRPRRGAARRERVAKGMWILTFHSMCARLLRREHAASWACRSGVHDLRRRRHRAADRRHRERPRPRSEAVPAEGDGLARSARAKDQVLGADEFARDGLQLLRGDRREGLSPPTRRARRRPARSTSTT